ncbi:GldG family protein [Salegentibacter mishustinae]|uniref:GldG family protein n=1 Tax=Salegentibacter mishustinae TaxID=270918 RepID=UPI001CE20A2E|nr:GldG family protein [Salegentibacter mishustinae]UBZ06909.1 GldG family protein [Salegentibacter mishustinae]
MKNFKFNVMILALFALIFTSCSKDENSGVEQQVSDEVAELYLGPVLNAEIRKALQKQEADLPECSDDAPAYAQISLVYGDADTPVDVIVPIIIDGNDLFTAYDEALEIPVASGETTVSVTLNDFLVWNDDGGAPGEVIWAAPKTGSDFGSIVSQSLPFSWDLRAGSKTYTDVEVLCFDDREVNLYGYQFFDIIPVEIYEFCVFANYCNDAGRHFTANYTFDITYIGDDNNIPLYTGEMPMTGNTEDDDSGDWYADPLCLAIPAPIYGEGPDTDYIRVTATLANWDANYPAPGAVDPISADLSWNEVQSFFVDDDNMDYWHIFFNCGDDDGGQNGSDDDEDGVPNDIDECPGTDPGVEVDEVGCESIQVPGRDVVVLNDVNIFDNGAMEDSDNVQFVKNLINFTTTGERNDGTTFMFDFGRNSSCNLCVPWSTMRDLIQTEGFTISDISSSSGTLTNIPEEVKIIMLVTPNVQYTVEEINTLKQFASEGGRIIFMGEHEGFYGASGIAIENQFLISMGAVLTNTGGQVDCGYTVLPSTSNRDHPIMADIDDLTIACASVIEPGEGDFPLFYDSTNELVLGGVAKIDTAPITELEQVERSKIRHSNTKLPNPSSSTGY